MLSFLNLKYFLLLTEELNFNSTAQKLNITQQSLSGHIKKMESYLGVQLFKYGPPLSITAAGLLLKERAEIIIAQERNITNDMSEIKNANAGSIKIGCTYARTEFLMPPIISSFQKKYPLVTLTLLEGNTPEIENALQQDEVDITIGFTPKGAKNIVSVPLYKEHIRLVVHPAVLAKCFPDRKPISFHYFNDNLVKDIMTTCPFLTLTTNTAIGKFGEKYFQKMRVTRNTTNTLELKNVGTMLSMCYSGLGFMFCPETFIFRSFYDFSKDHIIYPLPHSNTANISINYSEEKASSSLIKSFVKIAAELLTPGNPTY